MDNLPGERPNPDPAAWRGGATGPGADFRLDLRASHEDRERVAEQLRRAAADGRVDIDELEERLELAFAAKTYRDLQPLLADLPGHPSGTSTGGVAFTTAVGGVPVVNRSQAILGDKRRDGHWVVPPVYTATAVMGNVRLDLREASFAEAEATISCTVLMGEVRIRVAPDVTIVEDVSTVLAEVKQRSSAELPPVPAGGPRLRVHGTAIMGNVIIERLAPGERRVRRWRRGRSTS